MENSLYVCWVLFFFRLVIMGVYVCVCVMILSWHYLMKCMHLICLFDRSIMHKYTHRWFHYAIESSSVIIIIGGILISLLIYVFRLFSSRFEAH